MSKILTIPELIDIIETKFTVPFIEEFWRDITWPENLWVNGLGQVGECKFYGVRLLIMEKVIGTIDEMGRKYPHGQMDRD